MGPPTVPRTQKVGGSIRSHLNNIEWPGGLRGPTPEAPTDPDVRITRIWLLVIVASLPARTVDVVLTRLRSLGTCHVSCQRCTRRHPLPSPGSLRLVSLGQRYYETLRLPPVRFAALRFLRLAIPSFHPRFVPTARDGMPWISLELVSRAPTGRHDGDDRVSQVPRGILVTIRLALRPRCDQAG